MRLIAAGVLATCLGQPFNIGGGGCSGQDTSVEVIVSADASISVEPGESCGVGDWWDSTGDGICDYQDGAGIYAQTSMGWDCHDPDRRDPDQELGLFFEVKRDEFLSAGTNAWRIGEEYFPEEVAGAEEVSRSVTAIFTVMDPTMTYNVGTVANLSWHIDVEEPNATPVVFLAQSYGEEQALLVMQLEE